MSNLVLLKLGGSLITDKNRPHTPRLDVLERLAQEIAEALQDDSQLQVLLGHGAGSFAHIPASKYRTRLGVKSAEEWQGFVEVWRQAAELNHLVLEALAKAGLPALAFPPSAMVIAHSGKVASWNLAPLQRALAERLLPVIYGDVVFDSVLGGTILSTEDLFAHLVKNLAPTRLLLAGSEPGVWADFPHNTQLLPEITPGSLSLIGAGIQGSAATDVTGGMADKVRQVVALVQAFPGLKATIFSGVADGNIRRALLGQSVGTQVHN